MDLPWAALIKLLMLSLHHSLCARTLGTREKPFLDPPFSSLATLHKIAPFRMATFAILQIHSVC